MNIREFLKDHIVRLDGGMGTLLQEAGLAPGERPERWNLTHPEVIEEIHTQYFNAGANVVNTNTFGANVLNFAADELDEVIGAAVAIARRAAQRAEGSAPRFVALDIGPTGRLLKPLGDLDFEDAVSIFAKTVQAGVRHGVDLIFIETMNDSYETKAALLAAKESCDLPVFVSNAYGADGKLMTGATPAAMVAMLEGMGADAIGANCSFGPDKLAPVVAALLRAASVPIILKPNAGLPHHENGKTVFDCTPDIFAREVALAAAQGVRLIGGCCGTTPAHIKALSTATKGMKPVPTTPKSATVVSSYTHALSFEGAPILIGERINPTGKKRFKAALAEGDIDYILREGLGQQEAGADILDVNVGLPEIDEPRVLTRAVCELQAVLDLPLQIDTADPVAMEQALRRYNGKALVNSVNGKAESMQAIFPLVKKYGGVVIALTLDEHGIPESAAARVEIATRILKTAALYGIDKKDIVFDTLAMTVSADQRAAQTTLEALAAIRRELGCHTSLGVSNISFGLPHRDAVNSTFFAAALARGLSAAIMNPHSTEMMRVYRAWRVLNGQDKNCAEYIAFCDTLPTVSSVTAPTPVKASTPEGETLGEAIVKGRRERAATLTAELLKSRAPMALVEEEIIPALDTVGRGFEKKTVYLPQLLISAEAARAAFEVIEASATQKKDAREKYTVVFATVKGDIHDIGKNIVCLLLRNYGYRVRDLGRDVAPDAIAEAVLHEHAPLLGLSALMTTTVPAMEETVKLIREKAPWCRVMVGGAVLTAEYAAEIGADHYAPDAMGAVRYAESLL